MEDRHSRECSEHQHQLDVSQQQTLHVQRNFCYYVHFTCWRNQGRRKNVRRKILTQRVTGILSCSKTDDDSEVASKGRCESGVDDIPSNSTTTTTTPVKTVVSTSSNQTISSAAPTSTSPPLSSSSSDE